jgi:hypothetical protein
MAWIRSSSIMRRPGVAPLDACHNLRILCDIEHRAGPPAQEIPHISHAHPARGFHFIANDGRKRVNDIRQHVDIGAVTPDGIGDFYFSKNVPQKLAQFAEISRDQYSKRLHNLVDFSLMDCTEPFRFVVSFGFLGSVIRVGFKKAQAPEHAHDLTDFPLWLTERHFGRVWPALCVSSVWLSWSLPYFVRAGLHPSAARREKVINDRVGYGPMTFDIRRLEHGAKLGLEKNIIEVLGGRQAYFV